MSLHADSAPGEVAPVRAALRGQYEIQRELGRGGMGIVVLARDERLDRLVALKVLPPQLAEHAETKERFLREARMAAQLSHPNIVPVYRADEINGFAFFAMGFVEGETLGERIRDRGALPAADVVRVLREVAWALAYAHARGIVHRDVKPDNILLERGTGRSVVTDFGIARSDFNPALTQDGYVLGTVHFMSPEQASGEPLDGRSDLYALGCIGFLALSGRLPFEGSAPQAILVAHATKEPPSLRSVAPAVPPALAAVIDQCLRKRADDRFANGEELADALGKALEAVESAARDEGGQTALSSDDAMVIWRRAAELQAEAAARLESRMRATAGTKQLVATSMAPVNAQEGATASDQSSRTDAALPTDAYRLRDVEAAAIEAGISQRYVALALDELRASPNAIQRAQPMPRWKETLATRLFGTTQRTLSVTRRFAAAPRAVLQVLGRSLQAAPWSLTLRDTLGGHPLDGGVLVFDLPAMVDGNYKWTWTRYGVYVPELRVTLAAAPGSTRACEVTIQVSLREGLTANIAGYSLIAGGGGVFGGFIGALIGKKALLLAGAAIGGPALAGALLAGVAVLATAGPLYRWEIRKTEAELQAALATIDVAMRSIDIFGEAPTPPPPRPISSGGDLLGF
ncbi:serine/threonine-protein kinase [Gemmatimonas sp.]|uniref:serine/threonine-protein kinase n=1 Tax=Gemmatimonas sp. TaxID=1962908 RepID=UPI00286E90B1|nr:serine/threonine-protein kinase [Gemmatimonas sp.]